MLRFSCMLLVASSCDDRRRISTEPAPFATANPIVFIFSDANARELCNRERHRVPAEIHPICITVRTIRERDCSVAADEEDARRVASRPLDYKSAREPDLALIHVAGTRVSAWITVTLAKLQLRNRRTWLPLTRRLIRKRLVNL